MTATDRTDRLLEAGMALSAELSLPTLLQRIVELAAELTGARYAALGVVDRDGTLADFLTTGISEEERRAIGPLPRGRGLLGALIDDARPLRLDDISRDPRSVGFPAEHPPMRSFLGAPVRAHGRVFGNVYLTEKDGGAAFTAEDERTVVTLATQAGVAVANARLYMDMQRRERWLEAVREIAASSLAGSDAAAVLHLVAARAREIVGGDLASIVAPDQDDPSRLQVVAADGVLADRITGMEVPLDGSATGTVIASGRSLILDDAGRDGHTHQPMVSAANLGPMLVVPLERRGASFGSIAVARAPGGPRFHEDDVRLVESFAGQAALSLDYARAQQELARLSLVEDRERIAHELHDGVIQDLFAVGLGLQGAAAMIAEPASAARVQEAVAAIDHVIGDLRNYIFGLRPAILAASRLADALQQLGHEFQARSGVTTIVDVDRGLEEPLADSAGHIVQLVREALSNVGRHAAAVTCRVTLRRHGGAALLEVDDDGVGFDAEAAPAGRGMGLGNLERRVADLGGALDIRSGEGDGTTIRITLPVDRR